MLICKKKEDINQLLQLKDIFNVMLGYTVVNINSIENTNVKQSNLIEFSSNNQTGEEMKYKNIRITKRNDNRYFARYQINNCRKYFYGKTQLECYNNLKQQLKQKNTNTINKSITFIEWYKKFKELYKNNVKDTTIKADDYDFDKIKVLHNKQLKLLTAIEIQENINNIPYASTKKRLYILLNSIFEKAVDNEFIKKNPMKLVVKPKYKAEQKSALNNNEEQLFINACKKHKYGDYFLICLYQGLRKGECRALKVNDIDFSKNTLRVDESLNTHTTRTTTKNEQSKRTMPLFNKSVEILKQHIKNKKQDELIFNIGINRVDKALKDITKNLNIKHITTHILRHTFITRCQEKNIPLYVVQSWVGHEKGSVVTTKIYTHLNEETNQLCINKMNNNENNY